MISSDFPWYSHYDAGTPRQLNYPAVPLHSFLRKSARRYGTKTCCVFEEFSLTYAEMEHLSGIFAQHLVEMGLKKGDRVAVILPNCPQFVLAFYAISKAGGIVVAINPAYKQNELSFQLADSGARFAIVLDAVLDLVQSIQGKTKVEKVIVTSLKDDLKQFHPDPFRRQTKTVQLVDCLADQQGFQLDRNMSPDAPLIFQYSGGTTGVPKAAIGTHRNLVANTLQFRAWMSGLEDGEEVVLAAIPLFHVYGMVIAMSLGIALGATLVLISDPRDLNNILTSIQRYRATLFPGVPGMYQSINQHLDVQAGLFQLNSIKACISGSAPLLPEVKQRFEALTGGVLLEGYGLSEAPTATHCNPMLGENRTGSIGLPLPDVEARIVDIENGTHPLPVGESGELILRGPQVMPGYHDKPEENQISLRDGWLFTGDIARMDEDGYFYLVGRKKEMIKIGGFQVWPREVEEVIAAHESVQECAVAGVPEPNQVEMVKAWVVLRENKSATPDEIKAWCEDRMARYKVPAEVEVISRLPRTTVGKVLKRELVRQHLENMR